MRWGHSLLTLAYIPFINLGKDLANSIILTWQDELQPGNQEIYYKADNLLWYDIIRGMN